MDFFEVVTTQRAIRRLKPDPIPEAVLRQMMDAAIYDFERRELTGNDEFWGTLL